MFTTKFSATRSPVRTLTAIVLAGAGLFGGCGGGGGGGSNAPARTDILLTDAPADDLLAFGATITGLRLQDAHGGTTGNLLAGTVPIEFIALQQNPAWLASRHLPPGTYTSVRLSFAHSSYSARRHDGSEVEVNAHSDHLVAPFSSPLVIGMNGYRRVVVDLDLANSLQGSAAHPPLEFDPVGSSTHDNGHGCCDIDEVEGVVSSADAASSTFSLDVCVHDHEDLPLGTVQVTVSDTTLLIQQDGSTFPSITAFFDALVPGTTRLEVHGDLVNGTVQATRVEFDEHGGGGHHHLVKIRGVILALPGNSTFEMSIAEVVHGAHIVSDAFGGTIPSTLTVTWDDSTVFFLEDNQTTTNQLLAIGEEVEVRFPVFDNPPFIASRVSIASVQVGFTGTVTSISGLPGSFVMHLDPDSPAVLSGLVASATTDVVVDISASTIFLDTHGQPALTPEQILVGERVEPDGTIAGTPDAPTITAAHTKVFPGRLRHAHVTGISTADSTFTTSGGQIDHPFGGDVTEGPLTVAIQPHAVFTGDATTAAGFFELFDHQGGCQSLTVDVRGIGSGTPDSILAYEIQVRVDGGGDDDDGDDDGGGHDGDDDDDGDD